MTTFLFDGADIPFSPGQSVGAALIDHGIISWRRTRVLGRPRGIFCGIGTCYDCLITINGAPNERACIVAARPNMQVRSQEGTGRD